MRACARAELESKNTREELEAAGAIFEKACISRVFLVSVGRVRCRCALHAPAGRLQAGHLRAKNALLLPSLCSAPALRPASFPSPPMSCDLGL